MGQRQREREFRRLPRHTQAAYEIVVALLAGYATYFIVAYVLEHPAPAPYVALAVGAYLLYVSLMEVARHDE